MLLMLLLFSVLEEKIGEKLATRRRGNTKYNSKDRKDGWEQRDGTIKSKRELKGTEASGKMMAVEKMKRAEENKGVFLMRD